VAFEASVRPAATRKFSFFLYARYGKRACNPGGVGFGQGPLRLEFDQPGRCNVLARPHG
jgi:hypothetical protein